MYVLSIIYYNILYHCITYNYVIVEARVYPTQKVSGGHAYGPRSTTSQGYNGSIQLCNAHLVKVFSCVMTGFAAKN